MGNTPECLNFVCAMWNVVISYVLF